jgi:O-succinylbenzoic acid--CoA ligase
MSRPSDLAALRTFDGVLVGGGPVDSSLRRRAADAGIAVVSTYGMSETAGGCVYDGVPLDGVAVALGDEGEIRLAGPVLFDGYVGQPDLTASVLRDGWLHTPDLGRLRADGRLEVLGRSDDVVISGGVNVPLPAVEDRLATMPAVSACAVVAVADDEWGARIVAFVVAVDDRTPPPLAAVRDFVAQHLPRAWAPQQLVCVRSLPVLRSGKVDRQALMVRIGSGV